LLPFLLWIAVSALLFARQFHRSHSATASVQFTVSGESGFSGPQFFVSLNGSRFTSGEPCGLGRHVLRVAADGFDSFETNVSVGYFGESLGTITLKRSRGTLLLSSVPTARLVEISGTQSTRLENSARETVSLPIGEYRLRAKFQHVTLERSFDIRNDETTTIHLAPAVATLSISSEPTNAQFRLESPQVTIEQSTPATLLELPEGDYNLVIWQGEYRQRIPVVVRASSPTNEVKAEFTYTPVTITSEPTNAQITLGSKVIGNTPLTVELPANRYVVAIEKKGFATTNLSLTVTGKEPRTFSVTLIDSDYIDAIDRAHSRLSASDYGDALKEIEKALLIRSSAEALKLKQDIQFSSNFDGARQARQRGDHAKALTQLDAALALKPNASDALALKREVTSELQRVTLNAVEKRRTHPQEIFNEMTTNTRFNELFETQTLQFKGSLETVRTAIVRAVSRKPAWTIRVNDKPDTDTAVFHLDASGFGSKQNAVVVVGQTADNEVTVHFKIFQFVLGNNIQLSFSGFSQDSYQPLHPRFATEARAASVQRNLAHDIQDFRTRIEDELK